MNKKKIFLFIFCVFLILPMTLKAQTTVLSQYFRFDEATTLMKNLSGYDGWEFNENCWAMKGGNLQLGSTSENSISPGLVKTPELHLRGNAMLLLRVSGHSNMNATYKIYVEGGGTIKEIDLNHTINAGVMDRLSAIYISNGGDNTRLCIEGTSGKFSIVTIKVYDIEASFFYESFNYMKGENDPFTANGNASKDNLDNYSGASISALTQAESCVNFRNKNESKFITPYVSATSGNKALLTFKLSRGIIESAPDFSIACEGAKLGMINSFEVSDGSVTNTCSIDNSCYPAHSNWTDYHVVVTGITGELRFTFSGQYVYLDDVKLTPYSVIVEDADNTTTITNNQGHCIVSLTRTLGEGYWNTLCLPFDITQTSFEEATGINAEIQTLASVSGAIFRFNKVAADAIIEAGTPFLVKVNKQVVNPQFPNVVITNTPAQTLSAEGASGYQFVGTYSPVTLSTDRTNLFLGTDGKLHYPASAEVSTMKGLRAYFVIPSDIPVRLIINDEEMEAIDAIYTVKDADAVVYDIGGLRHHADALHKGIYIRNGRKVIVK